MSFEFFLFSIMLFMGIFLIGVAVFLLLKDKDVESLFLAVLPAAVGVILIQATLPPLYNYPRDLAAAQQAVEQQRPPQCNTIKSSPISVAGIRGDTVEVQKPGPYSGNTYTSTDLGEKVDDGRWPNTPGVFYKVYDATPGAIAGSITVTSCVWRQGLAEVGSQTRYEVYLPKG